MPVWRECAFLVGDAVAMAGDSDAFIAVAVFARDVTRLELGVEEVCPQRECKAAGVIYVVDRFRLMLMIA